MKKLTENDLPASVDQIYSDCLLDVGLINDLIANPDQMSEGNNAIKFELSVNDLDAHLFLDLWGDRDMSSVETAVANGKTTLGSDKCFELIRQRRDALLTYDVDPLVTNALRWADLTSEKQAQWTQYRKDLLNVPQQEGAPFNVTWPTQPSS
tara:strand:+ start:1093 stop:1548 length:456 start_codon:yes stop_codon:yes gene_type:complete